MRACSGIVPSLLLFASLGCSSAATPPPADAPSGKPGMAQSASAEDAPLQPVEAPRDLFVVGRLKHPERSLDVLERWVGLPLPWRDSLNKALPGIGPELNPSASVDVAVTLDPDALGAPAPLFAISLGISDVTRAVDALRGSGRQLEKLGGGAYFVRLGDDVRCIVARANGPTRGRLVCSDERKALDVLGPYMTRSMPLEALSEDDLFVALRAEPLRRRFGKKAHMLKVGVPILLREASLGNARFDGAISDAAHATADELMLLIEELEELTFRAQLSAEKELAHGQLELRLDGNRSWTSQTLTESARTAQPAPEMFWKLPADAAQAGYTTASGNLSRLAPIYDTLKELALGAAEHYGAKTASVEALVDTYGELGKHRGATVYAAGPNLTADSVTPTTPEAALSAMVGYYVVGVENDGGKHAQLVEQSIQVLNDPKLKKIASDKLDEKLQHLPQAKKIAARGLPKNSTLYELKLTPANLKKLTGDDNVKATETLIFRLAVVPEGERTWFGFATDPQLLESTLGKVVGGGEAETLGSKQGLDSLRNEAAVSAGFVTLAGYARSMDAASKLEAESGAPRGVSARDVLLAMPARGQTPLVFRWNASEEGPSAVLSTMAPPAALEDLAAGIVSLAAQSGAL